MGLGGEGGKGCGGEGVEGGRREQTTLAMSGDEMISLFLLYECL